MKTTFYSGNAMRIIVFLLLLVGIQRQSIAQCGSVSTYIPTTSASTVCSGNQLYVSATGLPVTKWIYRDNNTGAWLTYNSSNDYISQYVSVSAVTTRAYRAIVSTLACPEDTTASVVVTILPASYGTNTAIKLSSTSTQVCSGGQFTLRMMNQALQPVSWVYRDNGGAWNVYSYSGSTEMYMYAPHTAVPVTREFKVLVKATSNCEIDSSAAIAIQVMPSVAGHNPNIKPTSSQTTVCGGTSVSLLVDWPLEVGNWIYKDAGSNTWEVFNSNSTNAYDWNTNVTTSGMREYRVIVNNPANCSADTSDPYFVMINASTPRVLTSIQPRLSGSNTQVCAGNGMSFQITGYSNISSWIYKDSVDGEWMSFGGSSSGYLTSSNSITTDLHREVRVIINNSASTCSYDTSAPVYYTVKANVRGNTTTAMPFTPNEVLCVGAQANLYMQNSQTVSSWIYRNNHIGSWSTSFSSGNTYTDYSTSEFTANTTRSYRAIINNTTLCRIDTTPEVSVLFQVPVAGGTIAITPTVNQNAYCGGTTVSGNITIGNNRGVSKWIYRDNNSGAWLDMQYSSSTYFYDYNTTVTGATTRSYRALIRSFETLTVDTSLEVSVSINPVTRGTVGIVPISLSGSVCAGNSVSLSIVPPTGYTVNNWLYQDTAIYGWYNLGSSSTSITNYVYTSNTQRKYRVVLLNAAICRYDTTNITTVTVLQKTARNNTAYVPVASDPNVCGGTAYSLSISLPSGVNTTRWIYRDNGSEWKTTNSGSSNYYESGNNTKVLEPTVREYKVVVNDNNNCFSDTSAAVVVNISPMLNGTLSGITPTTTNPINCAGSTINANVSYTGNIQKWVYRDNGGKWNEFKNGSTSTYLYDYDTYSDTVVTREYRAYLIRPTACAIDTTQILSVQIRPYGYGNAVGVQPTATMPNVCSGSSVSLSIPYSSAYSVHKWIYQEGVSGAWKDFTSNTTGTSLFDSKTAVSSNQLRGYRTIILTNTCSYDTSLAVSVMLNARVYGYSTATTITSSSGVNCSGAPVSLNVVNSTIPSGSSIRSWLYMDNASGQWVSIPSSTSTFLTHYNTTVAGTTTRSYRVVLSNSTTCSYDSSSIFGVSINPSGAGYATTITPTISSNNVCNGSGYPSLFVSLPSGFTVSKWVVNSNGTGWTDFGYATTGSSVTDYNVSVQSPVSRSYRAIVQNSTSCSLDSTNVVGASINPAVNGTLSTVVPTSARTQYCYTKQVQVTVVRPSNYNMVYWLYSDNGGNWNIINDDNPTLTDRNTFVSAVTSRSYRAIMFNYSTCQRDTTSAITVIINPRSTNIGARALTPTSTPSSGICSGNAVTLNIVPGTGNELIKWTYSDMGASGPWYDVMGSYNQPSFVHQLTQVNSATARMYRAILTDTSTCDLDSSLPVTVNITPISYGIDTSIAVSGADSVCVGTTVSLSVVPGSGNSVTKWIYRDNSGPWTNFTNSTQSNFLYDGNTSIAPGSVRGYSPLILKSAVCRIDTLLKVKNVVFKTKTYGNSTTLSTIGADTVCAGSNIVATTSGSVEKWLYKDKNATSWSEILTASSYLSHNGTGVSVSGWRYYRAMLNTGSCNADSTVADSVYIKVQSRGNIAVTPTSNATTVCAGNTVSISLTLSNAVMQQWLYRDNMSGAWSVLSSSASFFVTDYNTYVTSSVTREYRAIVLRTCGYDTTDALSVVITPKGRGTDLTKAPSALSTSVCAASPVQNIQVSAGSGNSIQKWLVRDNGGAWQVFASGNQNFLYDYNTLVGTTVTRDYVAIIDNNTNCSYDTTAKLTVTINPVVLGNSARTVTVPAVACMNGSYNVSLNVSGDSSVIRFLSSYNGGAWTDEGYISPTTSANISRYAYNGTPYSVAYRAIVYKSGNCHIDTTAATAVSITPRTYGNDNTIVPFGVGSVCSGYAATVSVNVGSGNSIARWVYSDDGLTWTPYYSTSSSISVSSTTTVAINRQYRALIIKGSACTIDTTDAKSILINPIVYGVDTASQVTVSSGAAVCTGSTIFISTNPSPNSISRWLYSDNGGAWFSIYQTNNSIADVNTFVSSTVNRTYSAVIWKQATCAMDTITKTDTIAINPPTQGTDTTMTISPSASFICVGNSISLTANIGSHTVKTWYYRDNGGLWKVLSTYPASTITDYNTGVSVATVREYRALVNKTNTCAMDTSNSIEVNINPRSIGNDNAMVPSVNNATVCSGNTISVSVTPGSGNSVQKWIYSVNGGAWMDYAYTSATTVNDYNTSVSASTVKSYRAIVLKGSGCAIDTTASVSVTVNPIGFGNQNTVVPMASKAAICAGSNVTLSVSGFSGSSVLKWLYRDQVGNGWSTINASSSTMTDFNTQATTTFTREYRAIVNNTTTGCSTDTTASTVVIINPILNGTISTPVVASQPTVCAGAPANVLINPATGSVVTSWLYRDAGSVWTVLTNTSATSINDFNTNVSANTTREYRAIVRNTAGCSLDSSASVSIAINLITNGSNLALVPNTTTPTICSGSVAVVSISGFSGNVVKWLYRDSVVDFWNIIFNTNLTLFHSSTFASYPRTREYRAIVYNANNCSYDTTASVQMQINPLLSGNAHTVIPIANNMKLCSGSTVQLSASGFINGGVVTGWVISDNGNAWTKLSNISGAVINHLISVTGPITRQYRALVLTGCSTDTTAAITVTLDIVPAKPTITIQPGTDSLVCNETAAAYEWRLNGVVIPGAIGKVHIATVSGNYSVQVSNAADCKALSDNISHGMVGLEKVFANTKVTVYPNPSVTGFVNLEWEGLAVDRLKLVVMDMYGRVIMDEEVDCNNHQTYGLDLSKEQTGVYFITLSANGDAVTRKVSYVK